MQISSSTSAWSNALTAVNRGQNTVNSASEKIATGSVDSSKDFGASDVVSLKSGEQQVAAGAKVMQAYENTIGSIIDIEC